MSEQLTPKASMARELTGKVVSTKMKDTITVLVESRIQHPKYGKFIKRSLKVHAHDVGNQCREGDLVIVRESKPLSKTKRWVLIEIRERAA